MRANGWKRGTISAATKVVATALAMDEGVEDTNLEDLAHDQNAQLISARFKGYLPGASWKWRADEHVLS